MTGPPIDPPPPAPRRSWDIVLGLRHPYRLGAILILLLASLLRLHALTRYALWLDEGYSWWDARQSLGALFTLVPQCDPHPPLYFVLLKGWIAVFGDSVLSLRMTSALLGIATTGVVMLAGREISARVGLLAGLMFAITPFQIEFSHEVRPYALLCLGASLVVFGALRVAREMSEHRRSAPAVAMFVHRHPTALGSGLLALLAGGVVMLWTNDTSVLFLSALGGAFLLLFLLDRSARPFLWLVAVIFGLMVLLWLPNVPLLIEQAAEVASDFWIVRPNELWRVANELRFLVSASVFGAVWWSVAVMAGALVLLRGRGAWREALLLGAMAVVPVALNWGISMTIKPIYLARALIATAPAIAVTLAAGAMLIRSAPLRRVAVAALILAHLVGYLLWRETYLGKARWDTVAAALVRGSQHLANPDGAIVLVTANELALPLAHAFEDIQATPLKVVGLPGDFPAPGMKARYPSGKCAPSLQGQDLSRITSAVAGRQVVFFITVKDNIYDPGQRVAKFLNVLGWHQKDYELFIPGYLEIHTYVNTRTPAAR